MRTSRSISAAMALWLIGATLAPAATEKPGLFRRMFTALTWEETSSVATTPREICAAVRHHVVYKEDLGDDWATGKQTWNRGFGDCEDFAACVVDLCQAAGIETEVKIFCPQGSWKAHAVVVGKWKDQLWISSNGWFENVKTMEEAKTVIAKEQGWRHQEILVITPEEARHGTASTPTPVIAAQ